MRNPMRHRVLLQLILEYENETLIREGQNSLDFEIATMSKFKIIYAAIV